jgi:hypothetical protein
VRSRLVTATSSPAAQPGRDARRGSLEFVETRHIGWRLGSLLLFVQPSSERARQTVRQDCSFAKKQERSWS